MKIARITGTNVMGATFSLELAAFNLLVGRNFSGKTRVANAIKVALLGYLPGHDKTPRGIFKLASGDSMDVSAIFEDGSVLSREWMRHGDAIKSKSYVPSKELEATPLVTLDASDYFGRSPNGRAELVFSLITLSSWKALAEIIGLIAQIRVEHGEELADVLNHYSEGNSIQYWLEWATRIAEEERSKAAAAARMFNGALQGNAELESNQKPSTRSIEAIDADIDEAQTRVAELLVKRVDLAEELEAFEKWELDRELLRTEIGDRPDVTILFDYDAAAARVEEIRSQLAASNTEAAGKVHLGMLLIELENLEQSKPLEFKPDEFCPTCGQLIGAGHRERFRNEHALQVKEWAKRMHAAKQAVEHWESNDKQETDEIVHLENELQWRSRDIETWRKDQDLRELKKKLEEMGERTNPKPELESTESEGLVLGDRLLALRTERRQSETDRADKERSTRAKIEVERAVVQERTWKAVKAFLIERKAEYVDKAFGPLLATATRLTDRIFENPVEYRNGECGFMRGTSWISEETFSGTEQAMLHAALQAALAIHSPCRILIVDELGRLDPQNTTQFLNNLAKSLKGGDLEQVLVLSPQIDAYNRSFEHRIIEARGDNYVIIQ